MSKACILGTTIFFILFIVFLAISLYVFNLSLTTILKYKTVLYTNMTSFLIDTTASVAYLLFASMLLLLAGVMLYGAVDSILKCSDV